MTCHGRLFFERSSTRLNEDRGEDAGAGANEIGVVE